ncbi:MAG: hypothetical protein Kow00108_06260 [Calditrichia bacterium]
MRKLLLIIVLTILFATSALAQIFQVDPFLADSGNGFDDVKGQFSRISGSLLIPNNLLYGALAYGSGLGFVFSKESNKFADKQNVLADKKMEQFNKSWIQIAIGNRVDVSLSYKKYSKTDGQVPYSWSIGFLYNFFQRKDRYHVNFVLNFGEIKRVKDYYLKNLFVGGSYVNRSRNADFSLGFGINRTYMKLFPNAHPLYRKTVISNLYIYHVGLSYHLLRWVSLQASYLNKEENTYSIGFLITL